MAEARARADAPRCLRGSGAAAAPSPGRPGAALGPEHRLGKLSEAPLSRAAEWAWRLGWAAFYGGNSLTKTTEIHNSSFFAEVPKLEVPKKFQKDMSKFQKNQTTCLQRTDTYPW